MLPTLQPGQIVVAVSKLPKVGDIVIARQAGREVIKRVERVSGAKYYLAGDNPQASTDSRTYGSVERQAILGVMKIHFPLAVKPMPFTKPYAHLLSLVAAGIMTVLSLVQLFRIDTFLPLLDTALPGGIGIATILGCLLLTTQVAAVPYLLRIRLSLLAQVVSGKCVVLAPLAWVWICIWTLGTGTVVPVFGEFVSVESNLVTLVACSLWLALNVYVLYGTQYDKLFARLSKRR